MKTSLIRSLTLILAFAICCLMDPSRAIAQTCYKNKDNVPLAAAVGATNFYCAHKVGEWNTIVSDCDNSFNKVDLYGGCMKVEYAFPYVETPCRISLFYNKNHHVSSVPYENKRNRFTVNSVTTNENESMVYLVHRSELRWSNEHPNSPNQEITTGWYPLNFLMGYAVNLLPTDYYISTKFELINSQNTETYCHCFKFFTRDSNGLPQYVMEELTPLTHKRVFDWCGSNPDGDGTPSDGNVGVGDGGFDPPQNQVGEP